MPPYTLVMPAERPEELSEELNTYQENIDTIRRNVGKYVLIQGSVVDYYDTYAEALAAGYEMYGLANFLVREVKATEEPTNILRCSIRPISGPLKMLKRAKKT